MIRLVAFDWNGTLFADTFAVFESNCKVFKSFNLIPPTFNSFQKYFDVPVKRLYISVGVTEEFVDRNSSKIAKIFHENYEVRANKVRTRANSKILLDWLSKNNINSIIFSNHILEPINKQLNRLKLAKYFSEVIGNSSLESSLKGRSKKEKLKSYIDQRKILPKEVLIIGDTTEEIEIGKELDCVAIAITHGNCSTERLKNAKPDFLISNLKEVIGIITETFPN